MGCKNFLRHTLYAVTLLFVDESFGDRNVFDPAIQVGYKYTIHGVAPSCDRSNDLNDQGLNSEMVGQEKKQRHEAAVRFEREILSGLQASFESTQVSDSHVNLLCA